jgi:hypothetical protein
MDDPFERTDREWSLRAVELAGKASADVGAFGDRLRTLEIDIDDLRQTLDEQRAIIFALLDIVSGLESQKSARS